MKIILTFNESDPGVTLGKQYWKMIVIDLAEI